MELPLPKSGSQWAALVHEISESHKRISGGEGYSRSFDLINLGPFRDRHPEDVLERPHMDPVSSELGLTFEEETALYKYSQGKKDEVGSYGYMGKRSWKNLKNAVKKIPSMGDISGSVTVFRADRTPVFTEFLRRRGGEPCYIVYGAVKSKSGVRHLASAALTVNNHALKAAAIVKIVCKSARYIQYWGMHGASLDGGEVLIPAGTICYYDGAPATNEPFGDGSVAMYTLQEVAKEDVKPNIAFHDDFRGYAVTDMAFLKKILPNYPWPTERTKLLSKPVRSYGTFG